MGKEADCRVRVDGIAADARAHLDAIALKITGGHRLSIPLASCSDVTAAAGTLCLRSGKQRVELDLGLGPSMKWRDAIVSPKSTIEKIGVRATDRIYMNKDFDADFHDEVRAKTGTAPETALRGSFDALFLRVETIEDLARVPMLRARMRETGALWLVYVKGKGSPVPEAAAREAIRSNGLYDAKVVAFSATHTAVKAMIPLAARTAKDVS